MKSTDLLPGSDELPLDSAEQFSEIMKQLSNRPFNSENAESSLKYFKDMERFVQDERKYVDRSQKYT